MTDDDKKIEDAIREVHETQEAARKIGLGLGIQKEGNFADRFDSLASSEEQPKEPYRGGR